MKVKIYADGADLSQMLASADDKEVSGFTTNPTLMRKAGLTDYEAFANQVLRKISDLPISFEVFSDELPEMERQARKIASWGRNVYVKIPVTNTKRISTAPIINSLSREGIKLNITAVFTLKQVEEVIRNLSPEAPSIISIFAGRIANAGIDPVPIMKGAVNLAKVLPKCEILWASPREVFNIVQADQCGCHIITVTTDLLSGMKTIGKDLEEYSLETVQMFYRDAQAAGFQL